MKSNKMVSLVIIILTLSASAVFSQTLTNAENSAFADYLFNRRDYYRAITEYERLLFLCSDRQQKPWIEYKIAVCYYMGEQFETAEKLFRELKERYPDNKVGKQAMLMLAETYYRGEKWNMAVDVLRKFIQIHAGDPCTDATKIMLGVCILRLENSHSALNAFNAVSADSPYTGKTQALINELGVYDNIPQKNPWLAAGLSTVLPGAGQLYIQRPRDALLSFLLNGALIFAAYEAFDRDEIVTGSLISFLETGWYLGNIYNAASGAHKYNRRKKEDFFYNMELQYGLNLFSTDHNSLCPSLGIKLKF